MNRFGSRIFFASLALLSMLLVSILIFVFYPSSELIIQQEIKGSRVVISEVKDSLDTTIENAKKLSLMIYYNPVTFAVIKDVDSDDQLITTRNNERRIVDDFLFSIINFYDNILLVTLKTTEFTHYAYRPVSSLRYSIEERLINNSMILSKIRNADGRAVVIDQYDMPEFKTDKIIISIGRQIKNTDNSQEIGTILIDIDIENVFDSFLKNKGKGDFLIINKDNKPIISTRELDDDFFRVISSTSDESHSAEYKGDDYVVIKESFLQTDWEMIFFVNRDDVLSPYYKIRNDTIMTFVILFALITIISITYSKKLTSRFDNLLNGMREFEKGNLDVILSDRSNDELAQAVEGFNDMSNEIRTLIRKVYLTQIKQKDAEIEVRNSQINPHFIYNSLESIQMFAVINDQKEIARMVASLGRLLQTGLRQKEGLIEVGEEFEFIEMYLNMQKIRYHEKLDYKITASRNVIHKKILKFIIQPLVENSVVHGLENKTGAGMINVDAKIVSNMIILSVKDNGAGMNAKDLQKLREHISREDVSAGSSIGVRNVSERIKLYYGNESRFYIHSSENKGTKITIKVPFISEDQTD